MRKLIALVIALVFMFGMVGTAFASETEIAVEDSSKVNQNAVIKKDRIDTGDNKIKQAIVGNVKVIAKQENEIKNYGGILINFGDQTNVIKAEGGGNQNSGGNKIQETIKQKITEKKKVFGY